MAPRIYVLHENPLWLPPLAKALDSQSLAWSEWFIHNVTFDLSSPPPEGVFYNRMSASSHTRDHRYSAEITASIIAWLTRWGRKVVNGSHALDLEISKVRQYSALQREGIATPRTILVSDRDLIVDAAKQYFQDKPIILKPNRGGKGLAVQLFHSMEALAKYVKSDDYDAPIDGNQLLQDYIQAPQPIITRAEFVGQRFLYAVEVDTSDGFELCPADQCSIGDANCPTSASNGVKRDKFTIIDSIPNSLRELFERFLANNGIDIAGIEFISDLSGNVFAYDVNTNTNYNPEAELNAGFSGTENSGPQAIAAYLGSELAKLQLKSQ